MTTDFTPDDVLGLILDHHGTIHEGLDARVLAVSDGESTATATVALVGPGAIGEPSPVAEFRVTVERIAEPVAPRGLPAHLRDAGHASLANAIDRAESAGGVR